jgi:rod shape-determining protein MreC
MTWLSTIFHKNRRFISIGLAIIFFLLVLLSPGLVRPFLGNAAMTIFYFPFAQLKDSITRMQGVAEDNRRLKNLLTEASLHLSALDEIKRENQRLREFLGFEPQESFRVVPVRIIYLGHAQYPISAVINKGSIDSIEVNQPVINQYGLVGKIREVMADHATVQLLTDPSNAVSARIAESRQIGIVRYVPGQGMILDNLPADASIRIGNQVISSGLGGIYPPGLAIGVVDSVLTVKGNIKKNVWLKPHVDFPKIEELYVLRSMRE